MEEGQTVCTGPYAGPGAPWWGVRAHLKQMEGQWRVSTVGWLGPISTVTAAWRSECKAWQKPGNHVGGSRRGQVRGAGWWKFCHILRRPHPRLLVEEPTGCKGDLAVGGLGVGKPKCGANGWAPGWALTLLPEECLSSQGLRPSSATELFVLSTLQAARRRGERTTCFDLGRLGSKTDYIDY